MMQIDLITGTIITGFTQNSHIFNLTESREISFCLVVGVAWWQVLTSTPEIQLPNMDRSRHRRHNQGPSTFGGQVARQR